MKKPIPSFESDDETQRFVGSADLAEYDLTGGHVVRFELQRKDKSVNIRLPEQLLAAVRRQATAVGMPYQRFIRLAIERALQSPN